MIRIQVSLSNREYRCARRAARDRGISVPELLRRSLRPLLPVEGQPPWMRFAGMVASGNPRSSGEVDGLVHGRKD